jgi:hypothetical protein
MGNEITRAQLQRDWALCAIAAASSRFIPVPFLDDLVKERATLTAVSRTWRAHGRPPAPQIVAALAGDTEGIVQGLVRSAAMVPVTLLFYPWRKAVRLLRAAHGVSGDVVRVLLLARSVDRCLTAGWFADTDPEALRRQVQMVRQAHDLAVAGVDLQALRSAVSTALGQVKGLWGHGKLFARNAFGRAEEILGRSETRHQGSTQAITAGQWDPPLESRTAAVDRELDAGVREVEKALRRPDIVGLLSVLDSRFDAALTALAAPGPGSIRAQ